MATGTAGTTARQHHNLGCGHFRRVNIVYGSAAKTYSLGYIPLGAIVVDAGVVVATAFNSGTTDTLDIGTAADTDGFATLLSLQTAGRIVADEMATSNDLGPYTADTEIQAVYTPTGTAATAGSAEVYVRYLIDNDG